jgi:hypothetical protein
VKQYQEMCDLVGKGEKRARNTDYKAIICKMDKRRSCKNVVKEERTTEDWGAPSLLYIGHWVSSPGVKRLARCVDHPTQSSAPVTERIQL